MTILLQKFGDILTSREAGREAFAAFQPTLQQLGVDEKIEIDFKDIGTLTPSWADEFLGKLQEVYGDRLVLLPTRNLSALATIKLLEQIHNRPFKMV